MLTQYFHHCSTTCLLRGGLSLEVTHPCGKADWPARPRNPVATSQEDSSYAQPCSASGMADPKIRPSCYSVSTLTTEKSARHRNYFQKTIFLHRTPFSSSEQRTWRFQLPVNRCLIPSIINGFCDS